MTSIRKGGQSSPAGMLYGLAAYGLWGLAPLYFNAIVQSSGQPSYAARNPSPAHHLVCCAGGYRPDAGTPLAPTWSCACACRHSDGRC